MPGMKLPFASGGTNILSGNYFSGKGHYQPVGGVQIRADRDNSGNIFVSLSGGVTITSGSFPLSGMTGLMDGLQVGPGDAYFVPKIGFSLSGSPQIFVTPDEFCSGQARVYWECF